MSEPHDSTDPHDQAGAAGAGWFDAHVLIGAHPEQPAGRDRLDDHLQRYGLTGALAGSMLSWLHDPLSGNAAATAAASRTAGVRACWTAIPPTPGELTSLTALVRQAVAAGVAAFRLYPHTHGYVVDDPAWSQFFDDLSGHRMPLCLNRTEIDWPTIDRIAGDHPELPMIISLVGYRELRTVATMLTRHDQLHLDLVNFATHQGLEWLVGAFGARRILFGTGFGLRDPGESMARLGWSGLSETDVVTVGSANAYRLFGGRP
ncbi:amidohydrolase family protein [Microlunatus soli]|uniref:Amidohydrolase n=1 Tax=Microlunatus soli TaxID=630515 RepID=A0A1H1R7N6_9ACTN|nr:amidohydrolase family protein [Microlunatus soli]SDS31782.1 Amidohydrolase [Microlunatus soli]